MRWKPVPVSVVVSHLSVVDFLPGASTPALAERAGAAKSPRDVDLRVALRDDVDLRVALFDDDHAFVVYDAAPPPSPRGDSGESSAAQSDESAAIRPPPLPRGDSGGSVPSRTVYLAYWKDYATDELFVFGRRVYDPVDVGHALRNVVRDLGADPVPLLELDAELARARLLAERDAEDPTTWEPATSDVLARLIGPPAVRSDDSALEVRSNTKSVAARSDVGALEVRLDGGSPEVPLDSGGDDANANPTDVDDEDAEVELEPEPETDPGLGSVASDPDGGLFDPESSATCPPETMGPGPRRVGIRRPGKGATQDDLIRAVVNLVGCGGNCDRCFGPWELCHWRDLYGNPTQYGPCETKGCGLPCTCCGVTDECCDYTCCNALQNTYCYHAPDPLHSRCCPNGTTGCGNQYCCQPNEVCCNGECGVPGCCHLPESDVCVWTHEGCCLSMYEGYFWGPNYNCCESGMCCHKITKVCCEEPVCCPVELPSAVREGTAARREMNAAGPCATIRPQRSAVTPAGRPRRLGRGSHRNVRLTTNVVRTSAAPTGGCAATRRSAAHRPIAAADWCVAMRCLARGVRSTGNCQVRRSR